MKAKAMDLMSKSEVTVRYDITCRDEGGDIKKDTVIADSSVPIGDVSRYWVCSFAVDMAKEHPNMTVNVSGPSETLTLEFKDGEIVGGKKPEIQSKEMIEKYGVCVAEKDLERARKASGITDFTQEEIDVVEGLMKDEKTLSYKINCLSEANQKVVKTDTVNASEFLSPVDVLRYWINTNADVIPSPSKVSISLNGKRAAQMDYNA